jgi:hypothetical protein
MTRRTPHLSVHARLQLGDAESQSISPRCCSSLDMAAQIASMETIVKQGQGYTCDDMAASVNSVPKDIITAVSLSSWSFLSLGAAARNHNLNRLLSRSIFIHFFYFFLNFIYFLLLGRLIFGASEGEVTFDNSAGLAFFTWCMPTQF